jgi:hypothetical protein
MRRSKQASRLIGILTAGALVSVLCFSACTRPVSTSPAGVATRPAVTLPAAMPSPPATTAPTRLPLPQAATQTPAVPTRQALPSPTLLSSPKGPFIRVSRVEITADTGIYIAGATNIANGSCIQTQLLADKQPVTWWPKDVCIQVESGQWEILVSLGRRGAPAQLDTSRHYTLHAWWPGDGGKTILDYPITPP